MMQQQPMRYRNTTGFDISMDTPKVNFDYISQWFSIRARLTMEVGCTSVRAVNICRPEWQQEGGWGGAGSVSLSVAGWGH